MKGMSKALMVALILPVLAIFTGTDALAGDRAVKRMAPDLYCLAINIYHEARGEPFEGKLAVGHVVLNRVKDRRFPKHICSVVRQGGDKRLHQCHFSWWCDGRSDRPRDARAWHESLMVAELIEAGLTRDPTGGALWYHAGYVSPEWAGKFIRQAKIGRHIFYIANDETRRKSGV